MNLFSKLFGKKQPRQSTAPPTASTGPAKGEELIQVIDAYGRELMITRQDWRDKVLLGTLEQARDDPERLYSTIVSALNDGFIQETVPYAEHLQRTDPDVARGATLLGVVYLQLNRLDEAERVFQNYIRSHGENGLLLTNLAKVFSIRGMSAKADATLWHALEVDPNQDNGVGWYWSLARENGGEEAGVAALKKIAALPGSWRARVWLARLALEQGKKDDALRLYGEALATCPRPVPSDLLMQMSGDLGTHGHLIEAIKLTIPQFDVAQHGLQVGNNMIKANIDIGRLDHARAILDQLYALKRPDFQKTLSYWDTEIAKARTAASAEQLQDVPSVVMLTIPCPIWLSKTSPVASLFPAKEPDAVAVCFLGSSADKGETGAPRLQMADSSGRLARALPLFLCEQLYLRTDGAGHVLQPFIRGGVGGFVLAGAAWDDEMVVNQARQCSPPGDYVVITHLLCKEEPYTVTMRLVRTIDGSVLDTMETEFDLARPESAVLRLAGRLVDSACRHAQTDRIAQPDAYSVPKGDAFGDYLLRLEQALAVVTCHLEGDRQDFLNGEREMVTGDLQLCVGLPDNVTTRVLLVYLLEQMKKVRPQVVDEFREKVELLQRDHPLPQLAHEAVQSMLREVFAA